VRARSVRGLTFRNNTIERTRNYTPFAWQQAAFWLNGCREVSINGNTYGADYEGKTVWTEHMKPDDLTLGESRAFEVMPRPEAK
jgi:hypothetical protein